MVGTVYQGSVISSSPGVNKGIAKAPQFSIGGHLVIFFFYLFYFLSPVCMGNPPSCRSAFLNCTCGLNVYILFGLLFAFSIYFCFPYIVFCVSGILMGSFMHRIMLPVAMGIHTKEGIEVMAHSSIFCLFT